MASESLTITPAARGYLARAAAEARKAGVDAATQAALDGAARLGIGKPLFDGGIIPGTICEHSGTRVHAMGADGNCEYCHKDLILVAYEDMRLPRAEESTAISLTLDTNARQSLEMTVYLAHRPDKVYLRDGAGTLRAYRLDHVVVYEGGAWTAWLVRQTQHGRDYLRGGTVPISSHVLETSDDPRGHRLHAEISAAVRES